MAQVYAQAPLPDDPDPGGTDPRVPAARRRGDRDARHRPAPGSGAGRLSPAQRGSDRRPGRTSSGCAGRTSRLLRPRRPKRTRTARIVPVSSRPWSAPFPRPCVIWPDAPRSGRSIRRPRCASWTGSSSVRRCRRAVRSDTQRDRIRTGRHFICCPGNPYAANLFVRDLCDIGISVTSGSPDDPGAGSGPPSPASEDALPYLPHPPGRCVPMPLPMIVRVHLHEVCPAGRSRTPGGSASGEWPE